MRFSKAGLSYFISIALCFVVGCVSQQSNNQATALYALTAPTLDAPYTGRVYVVITPSNDLAPVYTNYWFSPMEIFATDVSNWDGKSPVYIDNNDLHFKRNWPEGTEKLSIQAVLRNNQSHWNPLIGVGNHASAVIDVDANDYTPINQALSLNEVLIDEWDFWAQKVKEIPESIEHISFKSELLSEFHQVDYKVNLSIQLPVDYNTRDSWPVLFYISGMGGSELGAINFKTRFEGLFDDVILVSADAMNFYGHSVFANSESSGPWRDFFVNELVPFIQQSFNTNDKLYLTGISSGGWSSLWLQLQHPETFSGAWSFVPDPVDFRDFLQVDLYNESANLYVDSLGESRPAARSASSGKIMFSFEEMATIEHVLGPGAQLSSINATFGKRDKNGDLPPFFDINTGEIYTDAIEHWKKYDIRLFIKQNWAEKREDLKDKITIVAGQYDNFYLEGAVELLQEELAKHGDRALVKIVADLGHGFDEQTVKDMAATINGAEKATPPYSK